MIAQEQNSPEIEGLTKTSKAILFRSLAVLWIFPTFGACWILASDFSKFLKVKSIVEFLSAVKIEEWLALILLLLHGVFIFLAIRFRRRERGNI